MYIVSGAQIKNADNAAINDYGIHSLILMERAALKTAAVIKNNFSSGKALIICGSGNNGGDGFAIARLLKEDGFSVSVFFIGDKERMSQDCRTNFNLLEKTGTLVSKDISLLENELKSADFVVDALFGVGFHGILSDDNFKVVSLINQYSQYTYSVDIPSGVSADLPLVLSEAVKANETITFTAYKKSAFLFPSSYYYGKITVVKIGIPENLIEYEAKTITPPVLKKKDKNLNKSKAGKVLVVAGSAGMSGAAYLSSLSALKSGAGLVTLAVPSCIASSMEEKTTEVMTLSLPSDNKALTISAKDKLCEIVNNYDSVVFGPGLGRSDDISKILLSLLKVSKVPMIIDADGLFALKDSLDLLGEALCEIIVTPHTMELSRLSGDDVDFIEENRYDVARSFSEKYAICTVLKGPYTIVANKDGSVEVNTDTSNPGMATAGSGDVLSGIIAAFAAVEHDMFSSAKLGVYLHGSAGDFAKEEVGEYSLMAGDIVNNISKAILKYQEK